MKTVLRTALAAGTVALLAGAASTSANAAPLGQNFETLKTSAPQASTDVQWRRNRGRNVAIGLGAFGAGVVVGSAIANQGYYGDPYGNYGPSYGYYEAPYSPYTANRSGNQVDSWDDPADFAGK